MGFGSHTSTSGIEIGDRALPVFAACERLAASLASTLGICTTDPVKGAKCTLGSLLLSPGWVLLSVNSILIELSLGPAPLGSIYRGFSESTVIATETVQARQPIKMVAAGLHRLLSVAQTTQLAPSASRRRAMAHLESIHPSCPLKR